LFIYTYLTYLFILCTLASADNLAIHEDKTRGVYVKGLYEIYVANRDEVYQAMKNGSNNRVVACTSKSSFIYLKHWLYYIKLYFLFSKKKKRYEC
jgi:hypothetical protein